MPSPKRPRSLTWFGVTLLGSFAPTAFSQMHHVDAPERVTRAIGVYEWTGELAKPTAARFVPVSLFIDGHLEDAGLYLARPTPFALQPGIVYALERGGEPAGLIDLDSAHRVVTGKALADDNPTGAWYAFGKFTVETTPAVPRLKPSSHPPTIQTSGGAGAGTAEKSSGTTDESDRPHMSRRAPSANPADRSAKPSGSGSDSSAGASTGTSSGSSQTPASSQSSGDSSTNGGAGSNNSDDTDRPTLRRRDPSQDAGRRREYGTRSKMASVSAAGPALGEDPDRPTLTHNITPDTATPELTGLPADMHQAVAVSDAGHRDAHPFARAWDSPAERAEVLSAMGSFARPRLTNYLAENNFAPSSAPIVEVTGGQAPATSNATAVPTGATTDAPGGPKLQRGVPQEYKRPEPVAPANRPEGDVASPDAPPGPKLQRGVPQQGAQPGPKPPGNKPSASAASTRAASPAPTKAAALRSGTRRPARLVAAHLPALTLSQEEVSGFTLSYGGLPTFVYTAAASAARKVTGSPPAGTNPVAFVTVVAQRLPTGEFQLSLANITDSTHLDRGPRLRLIDAVDPDDSHRASLLFELRGSGGRQFALYRLTSAHAEQTFTTASLE